MPYTLRWYKYGAYKKFSGHVTMKELLQSLRQVQAHPDYSTFKFTITDFLDSESIDFNEPDMLLYGAHAVGGEYVNRDLAIGIVVTDPAVIEVLKTRYQPLVHYSVGYFATLNECQQWIVEKSKWAVTF